MVAGGLRLAVIGVMLFWVGVAFGAREGNPPAGTFAGRYKITIRITNTRSTPTHWIYAAQPPCSSLCRAVSFRQRLVSEKSWRSTVLTFRWNGKAYALSKFFPTSADCRAKSGRTVKKGYDVTSSQQFRIRTVTDGRVVQWVGTGQDVYVPNAAGRQHHCVKGTYLYSLKGVTQ